MSEKQSYGMSNFYEAGHSPNPPSDIRKKHKKKRHSSAPVFVALAIICFLCTAVIAYCMHYASPGAVYSRAKESFKNNDYNAALKGFSSIEDYEDSSIYVMYIRAVQYANDGKLDYAVSSLSTLDDFLDSKFLSIYYQGLLYDQQDLLEEAERAYLSIASFRDVPQRIDNVRDRMLARDYADFLVYLNQFNPPLADLLAALDKLRDRQYSDGSSRLLDDLYRDADYALQQGNFTTALIAFIYLNENNYGDSVSRAEDCLIACASYLITMTQYEKASELLAKVPTHPESAALLKECKYQLALLKIGSGKEAEGYQDLKELGDYKDAQQSANEYNYWEAKALASTGKHAEAYALFKSLDNYKDSAVLASQYVNNYAYGISLQQHDNWDEAIAIFYELGNYADSKDRVLSSWYQKAEAHLDNHEWEDASYSFIMAGNYLDAYQRINEPIYLMIESLSPGCGLHFGEATGYKKYRNEKDIRSALISIYVPLLRYMKENGVSPEAFSFGYTNSPTGRVNIVTGTSDRQYLRLLQNHTLLRIDPNYDDPFFYQVYYDGGYVYVNADLVKIISLEELFYFLHSEEYHLQNQSFLF